MKIANSRNAAIDRCLNRQRRAEDCPRTAGPRYSRCLIKSNEHFTGSAYNCPAVSRCTAGRLRRDRNLGESQLKILLLPLIAAFLKTTLFGVRFG